MRIVINDHARFQEAVALTVMASAAAGLLATFLPGWAGASVTVLLVGLSLTFPRTAVDGAWLLVCSCWAGGLAQIPAAAPWATGAALGGLLAQQGRGWSRLVGFLFGLAAGTAAAVVQSALVDQHTLELLPFGLESLAVGAVAGVVMGSAAIGRELALSSGNEEALLTAASSGELAQLTRRAAMVYREARQALGSEGIPAQRAADDLVRRMAEFARRFSNIDGELARLDRPELEARLQALDHRLESVTDGLARSEFAQARAEVAAQLTCLDEITCLRQRVVARVTHQVALLERLRLQAVRYRSSDVASSSDLQPVTEALKQAGGELDLVSDALADSGAGPSPASPPRSFA